MLVWNIPIIPGITEEYTPANVITVAAWAQRPKPKRARMASDDC
jgi:hypothetical protein